MADAQMMEALRAHCHIDHNYDDTQLQMLYGAATDYLSKAGIPYPEQGQSVDQYQLTAFSLVLEWYEGAAVGSVTIGLRQLINQLKLDNLTDF